MGIQEQLRYFVLFDNGEIRYSKDAVDYKGTIILSAQSEVTINDKKIEMILKKVSNKEDKDKNSYCLVQPKDDDLKDKDMKNSNNKLTDWYQLIKGVIGNLKNPPLKTRQTQAQTSSKPLETSSPNRAVSEQIKVRSNSESGKLDDNSEAVQLKAQKPIPSIQN